MTNPSPRGPNHGDIVWGASNAAVPKECTGQAGNPVVALDHGGDGERRGTTPLLSRCFLRRGARTRGRVPLDRES